MTEPRQAQTTATGRVEAFSDGVFAIALTLLVLDLRAPEPGTFSRSLVEDWPAYVAYLIAFFTIGSLWLSHHNTFGRVHQADPVLLVINLLVLLGASLVPWPTALMSTAVKDGDHGDQVSAVFVYALVTFVIGVSWSLMTAHLARHPELLSSPAEQPWMRRASRQAWGSIAAAVIGASVALAAPLVALALFLITPGVFLLVSARARRSVET